MNKRLASAAFALAIGLAATPVLADQGFVSVEKDLLGSSQLPSDIVTIGNGVDSGEVGDFLNAIPALQASQVERSCNSAVQLPGEHLATTVSFCREVLSTIRDQQRSDEIEQLLD